MVQDLYSGPSSEEDVFGKLEKRLGRVYARLRLGIEQDHEAEIFGQGINFFHPENWYAIHSVIRGLLKLTGLYWLGRKTRDAFSFGTTTSNCQTSRRGSMGSPYFRSAICTLI